MFDYLLRDGLNASVSVPAFSESRVSTRDMEGVEELAARMINAAVVALGGARMSLYSAWIGLQTVVFYDGVRRPAIEWVREVYTSRVSIGPNFTGVDAVLALCAPTFSVVGDNDGLVHYMDEGGVVFEDTRAEVLEMSINRTRQGH